MFRFAVLLSNFTDRYFYCESYICALQYQRLWNMDLEDDTTVLTTLKSFNSFISHNEPPQRLSEHSVGSGNLQSQYKRSMEVHRDTDRIDNKLCKGRC